MRLAYALDEKPLSYLPMARTARPQATNDGAEHDKPFH